VILITFDGGSDIDELFKFYSLNFCKGISLRQQMNENCNLFARV